ncbi:metallophosphoesterase family protein [Lapidilactobacillus bayanensis]|uniref:metallophosphoesterase family protein n=1 Tax=Lapidilactobacillus bayanensis TaxID=2485998 RepID=UPI000F77B9ED|nr:metallophosphoesterase family protein [Lapidilactobacillus bayanensis]
MEHKIAIMADVHGNVTALQAVLADARREQVTDYWFLGDLFLPGPGTHELVELLTDVQPSVWLKGNWEESIEQVLNHDIDWADASDVYLARLTEFLMENLQQGQYQSVMKRPIADNVVVNGLRTQLSHNSPQRSYGHELYPTQAQANFDAIFADQQDIAVYAHTHQQIMRISEQGQLIINPGAVGQPYSPYHKFMADQRSNYAILTITDNSEFDVAFRKVRYNIEAEINNARQVALPYFDLYAHLRCTGKTVTHDLTLLAEVNAANGYRSDAQTYFQPW